MAFKNFFKPHKWKWLKKLIAFFFKDKEKNIEQKDQNQGQAQDEPKEPQQLSEEERKLRVRAYSEAISPTHSDDKKIRELRQNSQALLQRVQFLDDLQEAASPRAGKKINLKKFQKKLAEDSSKSKKEIKAQAKELKDSPKIYLRRIGDERYDLEQKQRHMEIKLAHEMDKKRLKKLLELEKKRDLTDDERAEKSELREKILIFHARESFQEIAPELEALEKAAKKESNRDLQEQIDIVFQTQLAADNFDDIRCAFNQLAQQTGMFQRANSENSLENHQRGLISPRRIHNRINTDIHKFHQRILAMEKSLLIKEIRILIDRYLLTDSKQTEVLANTLKVIIDYSAKLWNNMQSNETPQFALANKDQIRQAIRQLKEKYDKKDNNDQKQLRKDLKAYKGMLPNEKYMRFVAAQDSSPTRKNKFTKSPRKGSAQFLNPRHSSSADALVSPRRKRKATECRIQSAVGQRLVF